MPCSEGYLGLNVSKVGPLLHGLRFDNKQLTLFYPQKHIVKQRADDYILAPKHLERLHGC